MSDSDLSTEASSLKVTTNLDDLRLLPPEALINTSQVDRAEWNYQPLLGWVQRTRFRYAVSMLGSEKYGHLLEVGYGSGVFMPELNQHCDALYGIDVHSHQEQIQALLANHGVMANLFSGSVTELPFENHFFDCIIALSTLEFVEDIETACREMKRVLRPKGIVIVVTPGKSWVLDLALKISTGESAEESYANRRENLIPTLLRHFAVEQRAAVPRIGLGLVRLYTALKLGVKA